MTGAPMSDFILPAPDAPGEEWGRLAVSIPGLRWAPGMLARRVSVNGHTVSRVRLTARAVRLGMIPASGVPCPDDPATAGCLLALLGAGCLVRVLPRRGRPLCEIVIPGGMTHDRRPHRINGSNLGRACIAAAAAIGRWPGGVP